MALFYTHLYRSVSMFHCSYFSRHYYTALWITTVHCRACCLSTPLHRCMYLAIILYLLNCHMYMLLLPTPTGSSAGCGGKTPTDTT